MGFPPTQLIHHYDCSAELFNVERGWSVGKKVYCCVKHQLGCPTPPPTFQPTARPPILPRMSATTSLPHDCNNGFSTYETSWSVNKKVWCCTHGGRGCFTTPAPLSAPTTSSPYDCTAGFTHWDK